MDDPIFDDEEDDEDDEDFEYNEGEEDMDLYTSPLDDVDEIVEFKQMLEKLPNQGQVLAMLTQED